MTKFAAATWLGTLRLSTVFGAIDSLHRTPHSGIDVITLGPCLAPFDGVVTRDISQGSSGGLGNYFQMVSHDRRFVFTVGHGNTNSDTGLRRGANIKAGTTIMRDMGRPSTGYSTGPHYHEQLTDNGRLVNLLSYLGKTWGADTTPVRETTGWDGVSTLYKGNYANDGLVYTIHVGETIWDVSQAKGVTLDQVRAWTAALKASKYAGSQLAKSGPGASWWDGSGTYYAGATFAVADVVGKLAAADAEVAAAKEATAKQAIEASTLAADATTIADNETAAADRAEPPTRDSERTDEALMEAADQLEQAQEEKLAAADALEQALRVARDTLPHISERAQRALEADPTADPTAVFAGLLGEHPATRKVVYYSYAAATLLVSIGPDIVVAGVLTDSSTPGFVAAIALASSILLKIGTAFGFVAASNTVKAK